MSGRVWALLGSGEFLPWAEEVDAWMLARARPGPVLVLPTASAPEGDEVFDRWGRMGMDHYARLGIEAEVVPLRTRRDAERADLVSRLDVAGAVFFSGGNPGTLATTLAGTPFWASLTANLDRGMAYGGCSAGIAALGERAAWRLHKHTYWPGLGVVPGTNLAPHWDAVDAYVPGLGEALVANLGPPFRMVAVDERTAMVGDGRDWSVMARGASTCSRTARGPTTGRRSPSRSTWHANLPLGNLHAMVGVGDPAPDPVVLDTSGEEVRLSTTWASRPAVLAFLRHFG